ncbi:putative DNA helicase [Mesorhizobium escarrei]|uniref:DNA helicase n=1 Tax=Mesorhizobium escarrei TaxID=666018 RepID=A0ABM9EFR6_9HYPH|nr:putative DNA helicase [Mesorhizobium escarrei]
MQLRELFASHVETKQAQNVLDYDDLLLYWAQTVSDPLLAADIGGRFDHVLVDEYQDTNRLQASILIALKPGGRGLTVVGDDGQSIYSFRAASVRTKNLWTERQSAERPRLVTVRDETEQARYIVEHVLENREVGTTLKQQAVLFRT